MTNDLNRKYLSLLRKDNEKIKNLETTVKTLETTVNNLEEENANLVMEIETIQHENAMETTTDLMHSFSLTTDDLTEEIAELKTRNGELYEANKTVVRKYENLKKEIETTTDLKKTVADLETNNDQLLEQYNDLEKKYDVLYQKNDHDTTLWNKLNNDHVSRINAK